MAVQKIRFVILFVLVVMCFIYETNAQVSGETILGRKREKFVRVRTKKEYDDFL